MNPLLITLLQALEPIALDALKALVDNLAAHVNHAVATHPANQK